MKPTVISNANASASSGGPHGGPQGSGGVNIPINHGPPQQPQYHTQAQHYVAAEPHPTAYGSPGSHARAAQQQPHPQQQIPAHFQQDFDFEPDMGMDMFPRSRLAGRMTHDPFGDFGGNSHFAFPQFNSLGRRRANTHNDDDFFNRLPSEFRQYIPESFAHRRATGGAGGMPGTAGTATAVPTMVHPQQHQPQQMTTPQQHLQQQYYNTMPQSPSSKKVCDAAIQTEDPTGRSEVDHAVNSENLNQHGLRNTMDMGVKSAAENETHVPRSTSAPPTEQQQQYMNQPQQQHYTQQQQIPVNGKRPTPPPQQQQHQFGTQTSPQVQTGQPPQFQKVYYPPQQQSHPQQKQQTPPPPQTPGGSYIRTIPIFVEGRSEPIINNKEIPNQNAAPSAAANSARGFTPPKQTQPQQQQHQQSHRPEPLNTQKQPTAQQYQQGGGLPPQTPHTVDTINKIQDIQRDVLALMSRVEQFTGTRADKEYAYLDEMLTRNLLKLDNIDTNGKESIRLARKEAIKCIEASINVLEAKAEENKNAATNDGSSENLQTTATETAAPIPQKSLSGEKVTKESAQITEVAQPEEPVDVKKIQEPIPLPPPESQKFNMVQIEDCPEDEPTISGAPETKQKESSPKPGEETAAETK